MEFTLINNYYYAVTPDSVVHTVMRRNDSLFHVIRKGQYDWEVQECIIPSGGGGFIWSLAADEEGYLHLLYGLGPLWYATNHPDIGITEPATEPEPRQTLILLMAPSGFLISGYTGPIQVYDATGRLLLSREIEGKTLISPLMPGVYFVRAGEQRGRVAVLR